VRGWFDRITGGSKVVGRAKAFFGRTTYRGRHMIDIHGVEFYRPGLYHRFGFASQPSTRIGGLRFMRGGEQLFRKGVSSVMKETKYRLFKDLPDFFTHAKSQIISAKSSNLTRWRGISAERHLGIFTDPSKSATYGKHSYSFMQRFIRSFTKTVPTKPVATPSGIEFYYQKGYYPYSYGMPSIGLLGYQPYEEGYKLPQYTIKKPSHKPLITSLPKIKYDVF